MTQVRALLRRHQKVALDTSGFIYHLEANPRYLPLTEPIFSWLQRPGASAVTSTITMTELLVHPYRLHDEQRVDELYAQLSIFPNLEWVPPGLTIADMAARVRALHRLRTPDAIHAATALISGATALITNDAAFDRVPGFETLVLDLCL